MEETADSRKRKEHDDDGGEVVNAVKTIPAAIFDAEQEVEMGEAAVAEVMKWLEEEVRSAAVSHPPSSPSCCQEASFVTINGNEESCGPSFSSSACTVMASIDTIGGVCGVPYFMGCPSDHGAWPSALPSIGKLRDRSDDAPVAGEAGGCGGAAEDEDEVDWEAVHVCVASNMVTCTNERFPV
ncbi:uncharacterized protein LOC135618375 [Musa acuminata AAA Group]|uniref:uncharacterized protein LOC135618375 n=1 Tax=Musa acuminata AAA Group TaxID=214697 RepID=UPI0031D8FA8F